MTKHFSEADLLETYYTQPGESMPVMMHLAECTDCAARYQRLEEKVRGLASCPSEKPQTFWTRQRLSIDRRIGKESRKHAARTRTWRAAAAAVLAFFLGGMVVYKSVEPQLTKTPVLTAYTQQVLANRAAVAQSKAATEVATHDAWQSDELREFHGLVQWESWVDDQNEGGNSL